METNNSMVERLRTFMAHTGLTNSQFADQAGIPRPTLSQLLHGRNKSFNDLFLRRLNDSFPELDIRWLLFGSGNMLMPSNSQISEPQNGQNETRPNSYQPASQQYTPDINAQKKSAQKMPENISELVNRLSGNPDAKDLRYVEASGVSDSFVYAEHPRGDSKPKAQKRPATIIVLYSDGSFETFVPN